MQLARTNFPDNILDAEAWLDEKKDYMSCYKDAKCRILARSYSAYEALNNADSIVYAVCLIANGRIYPEISYYGIHTTPQPGRYTTRWSFLRSTLVFPTRYLPQFWWAGGIFEKPFSVRQWEETQRIRPDHPVDDEGDESPYGMYPGPWRT